MAAILGGTMRAPLTGVIFALELTHDVNMLLPLLLAGIMAHGFTVLTLRRSILTEKVSRRGFHLSREYAVDPLEIIFAREVARGAVAVLPAGATRASVAASAAPGQHACATSSGSSRSSTTSAGWFGGYPAATARVARGGSVRPMRRSPT